jgi:NADH dehydrogenase
MILVTGGAGFVGRHLIQVLAEAQQPVRVLLPPKRRRPWSANPLIEVHEGSIFDPESLHRALHGVHTVYHLASAQWWGSRRELEYIDLTGTQNVIQAGRSARIGRLIFLSQIGAEPSAGFTLLRVKGQVEEAIQRGGLPYTIFRCGVLFGPQDRFVNNLAMLLKLNPAFVFQPGSAEAILHPLHIDDLTQGLRNALDAIDLIDKTVEIGGAEYMTYNELLRTVMRVTRSQRQIVPLPPYLLRGLLMAIRQILPRFPMTPQWLDLLAGNRTADLRNLYHYVGISARRFEDTLLTYMPQRRYGWELARYLLRRKPRPVF